MVCTGAKKLSRRAVVVAEAEAWRDLYEELDTLEGKRKHIK